MGLIDKLAFNLALSLAEILMLKIRTLKYINCSGKNNMFNFGQKKPKTKEKSEEQGLLTRLSQRLAKTKRQFTDGLGQLFLGKKEINADLLEELETLLLTADVGIEATTRIIDDLTQRLKRKELTDPETLKTILKHHLETILTPVSSTPLVFPENKPLVILMVGINGAGKTTTIGKLTQKLKSQNKKVMLAAGDTFRAAAVEQLQQWGERNQVPVIAQHTGADSASVIFDALQAATARKYDVLIADTAGRLHTKSNLMDELSKIARVLQKIDADAPQEVMLIVDGGTGQNAINQAKEFNKAIPLTSLSISKLDGTAKGGVLFALAEQIKVPIRYIGVGEGIDDLREFDATAFVNALFEVDEQML